MTNAILPIPVPANRLTLSPKNVRRATCPEADARLRDDIAERGVLQNLLAIPTPKKRGYFSVVAGGRRLRAIEANIAAGVFLSDYPTPVLVLGSPAAATESSLAENFQRLAMSPADECAAFAHVVETEGATAEDVAKRFGVTVRFVEGRLRLARLAPPVLEALRDGEITLDVAMAFAASADTGRQARVFEAQQNAYYDRFNPASVRRQMLADGARGTDPRALFVGRDAYAAAGGRIEVDLFSDAGAESWADVDLLDRLAAEKLAAAAAAIAEEGGYGAVQATLEPHVPWDRVRDLRALRGDVPPLTEAEADRAAAIETELSAIEADAADEEGYEYTEEEAGRCDALQTELDALLRRPPALSPEQKAAGIAFVVLGSDGAPRLHHQVYAEPSTAAASDGAGDDGPADRESGDAEDHRSAPALAQRLQEELAVQRVEILRLHVASQPHVALDLGTFLMADRALNHAGSELSSTLAAASPPSRVGDWKSGAEAARAWDELEASLDRGWASGGSAAERYDAFRALPEEARAAWLGWAVARTLEPAVPGKTGSAFVEHLGAVLGIDAAAWWRPTVANYFGRVAKPLTLSALAEVGGPELRSRYAASKKLELATAAERLFRGDAIAEAETKAAALRWLPAAMTFGAVPEPASDDAPAGGDGPSDAPDAADDVERGALAAA